MHSRYTESHDFTIHVSLNVQYDGIQLDYKGDDQVLSL